MRRLHCRTPRRSYLIVLRSGFCRPVVIDFKLSTDDYTLCLGKFMSLPRLAEVKASLHPWRLWLAARASVLSKFLSGTMLIGLAGLSALVVMRVEVPSPQVSQQQPAIKPVTSRQVKVIHMVPDRTGTPAHAEPQKIADVEPSKAEQSAATPKVPELSPPRKTEEPSQSPASNEPRAATWSEAEVAKGLQDCVRQLAPITAEVEVLAPLKNGTCGAPAPISVRNIGVSKVEVQPAAVTTCQMALALHQWVEATVQPAAKEIFGSPVKRLIGASSYACRNRNSNPAGPISEHAFANAIDIAGFVLADGRTISVLNDWGPTAREQKIGDKSDAADKSTKRKVGSSDIHADTPSSSVAPVKLQRLKGPAGSPTATAAEPASAIDGAKFLHQVHKGACGVFSTILGPEANAFHRDHFHLDLKVRKSRAFCE